ncbi:MAG: GNAT family N-acetyltransferase [Devosia sp.]|nr:GNAT family N-acetyltransferase [Devosia sp.]
MIVPVRSPVGKVELLTSADAEGGLALSTEAGWNQLMADWNYLLAAGQGFGVRADGRLIATSLALPYPPRFGWVSMVLVSQAYRRRGLATLLLQAAVDRLLRAGLVPMLDATPEGRAVYSRLGFVGVEDIDRWRGEVAGDGTEGLGRSDFAQIASIDLSAFGADRLHLLAALGSRPGSSVLVGDGGYAIVRRGRLASQVGPVVASTVERGRDLARAILDHTRGAVIADVPRSATDVARDLIDRGFTVQRSFHRMAYGRSHGLGNTVSVFATAGPELG